MGTHIVAHLCYRQLCVCRNVIFRFRDCTSCIKSKRKTNWQRQCASNRQRQPVHTKLTPFGIKLSASYASTLRFAPDHVLK